MHNYELGAGKDFLFYDCPFVEDSGHVDDCLTSFTYTSSFKDFIYYKTEDIG